MIHVRKPMPPKRGNSWYRDKRTIESATFCGSECTSNDVAYRDTGYKKFNANDPFWVSRGGICAQCLELAATLRAQRHA